MKFCLHFLHLSSDVEKVRHRDVQETLFSKCEFRENRSSENHTLLRVIYEFHPHLLSDLGEIRYKNFAHDTADNCVSRKAV
jgi:hypothetical protein